jgi:TRAP-type C4-dicarboxylate transport system substrate-binding protein
MRIFVKSAFSALFLAVLVHQVLAGQIRWDMPTPYGDASFHTENIRQFAEDVKVATGGDLAITVHSAGSLIKHPEIKNAVRRGLVPIGEIIMSRLANEDPVFEVDSIPFLATTYAQAGKLWDASRPIISNKLGKQDVILLFAVPWPPQGIYAKKLLSSLDSFEGLSMRAYNKSTERLAQLAGAVPTQVEVPDIPTAFSTGRVDAMITSPTTGVNTKAWDYVTHFHHTQAWLPKNMVMVNKAAFNALTPENQEALVEAAEAAEIRGWNASRAETDAQLKILRKNGMKVIVPNEITAPSEKLISGLRKIGRQMTEEWLETAGEEGKVIIRRFREKPAEP